MGQIDEANHLEAVPVPQGKRVGERKSYLDILRILACFLVIFNHLPGDELYKNADGLLRWIYLFITAFTRINVPIFFMISGALLLPREESLSKVLKQRAARTAVVLVVFSAIMYVAYDPWGATLKGCVKGILTGNIVFAYWYLYAYLGFLLMLPFLRMVAKGLESKEFKYLLVLYVCFVTLWRLICAVLSWRYGEQIFLSVDFSIPLVQTKAFFYPLVGYYLDRVVQVQTLERKKVVRLAAAAVLGILAASFATYVDGLVTGQMSETYTDLFAWLTAAAVFVSVKFLVVTAKKQIGCSAGKILAFVSSLTFGIYLLDPLLQHLIFWPFIQSASAPALPVLMTSVVWCIFSMTLGGDITYLLKKASVLL